MDFFKASMTYSNRTKTKKKAPSAIKKSPVIRKQIESSEAYKNVNKEDFIKYLYAEHIDWQSNYLPIVIKG